VQIIKQILADPLYAILCSAVVSLLLGYSLPYIKRLFVFTFIRKRKSMIRECKYFYYVWKVDDEIKVSVMNTAIKKGWFYEYKIRSWDDKLKIKYEGDGYIESGYLCIDMKSDGLEVNDSTHHKYNLSNLLEYRWALGFFLSVDDHKIVICGGAVLSKDELKIDYVKSIFNDKYQIIKVDDTPLMTLK